MQRKGAEAAEELTALPRHVGVAATARAAYTTIESSAMTITATKASRATRSTFRDRLREKEWAHFSAETIPPPRPRTSNRWAPPTSASPIATGSG